MKFIYILLFINIICSLYTFSNCEILNITQSGKSLSIYFAPASNMLWFENSIKYLGMTTNIQPYCTQGSSPMICNLPAVPLVLLVDTSQATKTIYVDCSKGSNNPATCGTSIDNACSSLWLALNTTTVNDTDIAMLLAPGTYSGKYNTGLLIYNISVSFSPIPTIPNNTVIISNDNNDDTYKMAIQPFIIIPPPPSSTNITNNNNTGINGSSTSSSSDATNGLNDTSTTIIINSIQFNLDQLVSGNGSLIDALIAPTNVTSSVVSIEINDCYIANANVGQYGGAISIQSFLPTNSTPPASYGLSSVLLNGSIFSNCSSQASGGAVYITLANTLVESFGSTFHNNSAYNGSAIFLEWGTLTMNDTTVYDHTSLDFNLTTYKPNTKYLYGGGAIYLYLSQSNITASTFTNNNHLNGGAILSVGNATATTYQPISISNCTFTSNNALVSGGAISSTLSSNISITAVSFSNNSAVGSGGSLFTESVSSISIDQSQFQFDHALYGGSICLNETTGATVTRSNITNNNNHTILQGAGILVSESTVTVNFTAITGNYADMGASIYCSKTVLLLSNNSYANNTDAATTKNQVFNLFCGTQACTITNLDISPTTHKCRTIEVITPKRLPPGVIIGIVIGCVLGSFLIFLIIVMVIRNRSFSKSLKPLLKKDEDNNESIPNNDIDEE
ncbi:hypothetical protein DFA_00226 [Cavenderia fasciculata]|uniref:Pectin lyase-like family protein n=1 Tax=Cavenderia fasciculata TaxID=261658 RepID=F4PXY8_CACFS|nr:uncharacterized protein DFA_00226 [Cavenderia fasciculata]EGG19648.1 hypothetical protein DFA_00226 [Cavenderia fasciculata]|eukprot:XP_004357942.1 hypothetical protein DFA_00226 [Cavenderia fasciculata]